MATQFNGVFLDNRNNGITRIGDDGNGTSGAGSLTVDAGTVLDLTSANLQTQKFQQLVIGGTANSQGVVEIGVGSTLAFSSTFDDTSTGIVVGRNGGDGRLYILGKLSIQDTSSLGPDLANDSDDETLVVGRGQSSYGQIIVENDASLDIDGNSINMQFGRDGGRGNLSLNDGATLALAAHGTGVGTQLSVRIANGSGSNGSLTMYNSTATLNGMGDAAVSFSVGISNGTGRVDVGGSTLTLTDGSSIFANIGHGGTGTLRMFDSGKLRMLGTEGSSALQIGLNGGIGNAELSNASQIEMSGQASSHLLVGSGGDGTVKLSQGSLLSLDASGLTNVASVNIGGNFGVGSLDLATGSKLSLSGGEGAHLIVGGSNGVGSMKLKNSEADLASGTKAYLIVGHAGGVGNVLLDRSTMTASSDDMSEISVGHDGSSNANSSGAGTIVIQNNSTITFDADKTADFLIGGGAGSSASVSVRNNSVIDMGGEVAGVNSLVRIGSAGGSATVVVGSGSQIRNVDSATIGYIPGDNSSFDGGAGGLYLRGGTFSLTTGGVMKIRAGGVLGGSGGLVHGTVQLVGSARLDFRDLAIAEFEINGDLKIGGSGNVLNFDVVDNQQDRLDLAKLDTSSAGQLTIRINPLDDYDFAAGEIRTFLTFDSIAGAMPAWLVSGQHPDFGYYGGMRTDRAGQLVFQALNNGTTSDIATLDFGTGGTAAKVSFSTSVGSGTVSGGVFGTVGGKAYNVDKFLGTNTHDVFVISGTSTAGVTVEGRGGNDVITTASGKDSLLGGDGNDTLNGGAGADTLNGGAGNDTYILGTDTTDKIVDSAGIDLLTTTVTRSLSAYATIENLSLLGTTKINGTGNALANTLTGNAADNILNGGAGKDSLIGGLGSDTFVFDTKLGASNIDTIGDFSLKDDTIWLDDDVFTKVGKVGDLTSNAFYIGTKAHDADDRIIYDKTSGKLWYDADGNGAGVAIQFAALAKGLVITASDFDVIG